MGYDLLHRDYFLHINGWIAHRCDFPNGLAGGQDLVRGRVDENPLRQPAVTGEGRGGDVGFAGEVLGDCERTRPTGGVKGADVDKLIRGRTTEEEARRGGGGGHGE